MKKIFITFVFATLTYASQAQDLDLGSFLEGGVEDGNKLMQSYLEPVFVGFGYAMNAGWYNTGKPHKVAGFDLTINVNAAQVPTSAQYFTINPSDYNNLTTAPAERGQTQYPTILGPNLRAGDIPYLVFNENTADEYDDIKISAPTGLGMEEVIGFNAVPAPAVQVGIGLIKNTELKIRLVPEQTFGDPGQEFSTKLFGLGVMHDVKQWIPGIKNLPFDLSGFFAFSKMTNRMNLDSNLPDNVGEFDVSGTTFQAIVSKKLAILTLYGAVGYSSSNVKFNMKGEYATETATFTDPISLEYSNGGFRANIGARIKLLIFTFHAAYAVAEYNTVNAGFGISIR